MAERKFFSRYNMRCGLILRAEEANRNIKEIKLPSLDQRFLLLRAEDIEKNEIEFLGSSMPILADTKLSYVGQPVLALFGPDFESVELALRQVKVITEPIQEEEGLPPDDEISPLFFSWGQDEAIRTEEENQYKIVDSEFTLEPTTFISNLRYTVTANKEKEVLYLNLPTEWPDFVKNTVAKAAEIEKKAISIKQVKVQNKHDEYLFMPAIYAALAAIATSRLALPVEMRAVGESARAGMVFKRHTILTEDYRPISESVEVEVDQGAFIFAGEEMQRQIMTGLIPTYSLKSFIAKIVTKKSSNHPAAFSGSLGYVESLAATEFHNARIAEKNGITPAMQKARDKSKTRFTDYAPSFELEHIGNLVKRIEKESVFDRKWATNIFQHNTFSLVGYLKGIGLATGTGIAGFSTNFAKETDFTSIMTYTQKKNISVNSFVKNNDKLVKYWKNLISSRIEDEGTADNVVFLEQGPNATDSGPDVLSRYYSCFTSQLAAAAKKLNVLRLDDKLPVSLKFNIENTFYPCEFEHSGFGAVITEIKISSITFAPVVTEIWANFALSHMIDKMDTYNKARTSILTALEESGALLDKEFSLHLYIDVKEANSETLSSIEAIARSLTMSSFANALYQAAGAKATTLPTSAAKIERAINGGQK